MTITLLLLNRACGDASSVYGGLKPSRNPTSYPSLRFLYSIYVAVGAVTAAALFVSSSISLIISLASCIVLAALAASTSLLRPWPPLLLLIGHGVIWIDLP